MIPKMGFGVRQVRDFLSQNGCVLTVRGYNYKTQSAIVPELNGIRIKRMKLGEVVNMHDLDGFILLSGFSNVRDWWQQIKRFCKGRMWLYRVQIDDAWLSRQELDNEKIEQQRMFAEQNAGSNEEEIVEIIGHPLDIRGIDTDPALIDLQPCKNEVHEARMQREAQQAERRRGRMRARYEGQGEIRKFVSGA
jgi:hypothetical protein